MPAPIPLPDVRQQGPSDCGAACAAAVLVHFGRLPLKYALDECSARLLTSGIDGTDPRAIEALFRAEGLRVQSGEMTLPDLRWHTDRGRPVVVVTRGHYLVVRGLWYTTVYVHDPLEGPKEPRQDAFLVEWEDVDRFGTRYRSFGIAAWRP